MEEIIKLLKEYFAADDAFLNYNGPDKYSSISTDYTKEHIILSENYFNLESVLLSKIAILMWNYRMAPEEYDSEMFWQIKTWYDIHSLAKDNSTRMIKHGSLSGKICREIMSLSFSANNLIREYLKCPALESNQ